MTICDSCYWQSDECLLGLEPDDDDCPHYIDREDEEEDDGPGAD